jgi:ABC-type transport system involved in cytochrome bd biosynthesis fused ATPase/permease subunit
MSFLTIVAALVLVLTPPMIPVTIVAVQVISDRRFARWVASQNPATARELQVQA